MTHFNIEYTDLDNPKTIAKAVKDVKNFIGHGKRWDNFIILITAAISTGSNMGTIRMMCSFTGVEGYPVEAVCHYICDIIAAPLPVEVDEVLQ